MLRSRLSSACPSPGKKQRREPGDGHRPAPDTVPLLRVAPADKAYRRKIAMPDAPVIKQ